MAAKHLQGLLKDQTLSKTQRRTLGFVGLIALIPTLIVVFVLAGFLISIIKALA